MATVFWLAVAITCVAALACGKVLWDEQRGAVVLLYHRVRTHEEYAALHGAERNFSIPDHLFRQHMTWLKASGRPLVTADGLYDYLTAQRPGPPPVCVTFDDGSESVARLALPILTDLDIPAVLFVTTDPAAWVFEDQRRVTDEELRALSGSNVQIGSHAVSHHGLNGLPDAALAAELADSRTTLETVLSQPVRDVALPLNFYDERVLTACRDAGYRMTFTADPGRARPGARLDRVRRIAVEGQMTLPQLQRSLTAKSLVQRRALAWLKRVPPRLLGETRWMPLRARIFASPIGPLLTFRGLRTALIACAAAWVAALVTLGALVL